MTENQADTTENTDTRIFRKVTKFVIRASVAAGAGRIAHGVIGNNMPAAKNKRQLVGNILGAAAVAGVVGERAGDYSDEKVDAFFDGLASVIQIVNTVSQSDKS